MKRIVSCSIDDESYYLVKCASILTPFNDFFNPGDCCGWLRIFASHCGTPVALCVTEDGFKYFQLHSLTEGRFMGSRSIPIATILNNYLSSIS